LKLAGPFRLILALILSACTFSAQAKEILTLDGLDPVRIGMSKWDAEKALGVKLKLQGDAYCATAERPDRKAWYMFEKFRVVRIDVGESPSDITTVQGLGIGSTEISLRKAFGRRAIFTEHPYMSPGGHYVTVHYRARHRDLLFETYEDKVTSFRVGLPDSVRLIEGCS
jgi:hypothetical protein